MTLTERYADNEATKQKARAFDQMLMKAREQQIKEAGAEEQAMGDAINRMSRQEANSTQAIPQDSGLAAIINESNTTSDRSISPEELKMLLLQADQNKTVPTNVPVDINTSGLAGQLRDQNTSR